MLSRKQNRSTSRDWHDIYDRETVERANLGSALSDGSNDTYTYIGVDTEPERAWNDEDKRYDGPIIGQGLWIVTNFVDSNGQRFVQNPVKVIVAKTAVKGLEFGCQVHFKNLLGYFSKKKYSYSFRADDVEVVRDDQ